MIRFKALFGFVFLLPLLATAQTKVLDFEGLGNFEPINQFYNGGTGGNGSGPGVNYGISFSSNSLAIIDSDAGGGGNFGGEPSPDTVLFFQTGTALMNVPAGFTTGFSFYYSAVNSPGIVVIYDGANATGNVLATINLPTTPNNGAPDPTGSFSPFVPVGVSFSGTARSVDFGGTVNQIAFDNLTLGRATPAGAFTTCAAEGFTGPKLTLCQQICEVPQSPARLGVWIKKWLLAYRVDPPCGTL